MVAVANVTAAIRGFPENKGLSHDHPDSDRPVHLLTLHSSQHPLQTPATSAASNTESPGWGLPQATQQHPKERTKG